MFATNIKCYLNLKLINFIWHDALPVPYEWISEFHKFNITWKLMLDSIYYKTWENAIKLYTHVPPILWYKRDFLLSFCRNLTSLYIWRHRATDVL